MNINNLPLIEDDLKATDVLLIENEKGTFRVTLGQLSEFLSFRIDEQIHTVERNLSSMIQSKLNTVESKADAVSAAYYSLQRNYNTLNSGIEAVKEHVYADTE